MTPARLLCAAPLVAAALASGAQACTDGSRTRTYFSYQRPSRGGDLVLLRVQLVPGEGEGDGFSFVLARLLEGPSDLTRDGFVRIEFPEAPVGTNCVALGPVDGPVFVTGRLRQTAPGVLTLVATPTNTWRFSSRRPYDRRSELDQYIVDPAFLPPAWPRAD